MGVSDSPPAGSNLVVVGTIAQRSEGSPQAPGLARPVVRVAAGGAGVPGASPRLQAAATVVQAAREPATQADGLPRIEAPMPAPITRQPPGSATTGSARLPLAMPLPAVVAAPLAQPQVGGEPAPALQRSAAPGAAYAIVSRSPSGAGGAPTSTADTAPARAGTVPQLPTMSVDNTSETRPELDIERVTDQVYQRLVRRLVNEREQRGW